MSKKINPASIGLFIVIGVALGVSGVLLFSSSKLFTSTRNVIVYFDQSLNGLDEGAPVKYRGVTIGSVKRVMVRYNQAASDFAMPVILELQEDLLQQRLGEPVDIFNEKYLEARIKMGLRASLQTESLVTGVLYVEIRPNPHAPPPEYHQLKKVYTELPSESTQIQQLFERLAALDIKSIETNVNTLLAKLDQTIGSLNMIHINQGVTNLLASLDRLVSSSELTNALAAIHPTVNEYRLLAEKMSTRIDPLMDGVTNSLSEASSAMVQVRRAAENLETLVAPDAPLATDLDQTLQQLSGVVQSLGAFLDYLKQHPNALITGRRTQERKP